MNGTSRRTFLQSAGAATLAAPMINNELAAQGTGAEPPARRFQLGIVTYNIAARWDLATILRVCRNVGIAAVELRTTHRHGVEPTLNAQQRRDIRRQFADAGVAVWGCGTTCEFHSTDANVVRQNIDTCRTFIQLVADLGGRGVKVRPNGLPRGVPENRTLQQIGRSLRACGEAANNTGVEICVEVHGRGTAEPSRMQTIMQQCNHRNVGLTWNCNPTDVVDGSVRQSFQRLRPWIRSVHIHDLYDNYPYREFFRLLRGMNYDRYTLAEIPGTPDVASGERLLRFYKALWNEMA